MAGSAGAEVTFSVIISAELEKFALTLLSPEKCWPTHKLMHGSFFYGRDSGAVVLKSCSTFPSVTYLFSVHAALIQHITPGLTSVRSQLKFAQRKNSASPI